VCSDSISSPRTGVEAILTELGPENQNWRYASSSHRRLGLSIWWRWVPPEVVPTELGGGRRLLDACAGPEVDSASKMYLEEFGGNRQKPLKMCANQGPPNEGPDSEALCAGCLG
jgi:hypothetical protein